MSIAIEKLEKTTTEPILSNFKSFATKITERMEINPNNKLGPHVGVVTYGDKDSIIHFKVCNTCIYFHFDR